MLMQKPSQLWEGFFVIPVDFLSAVLSEKLICEGKMLAS